MAAKKLASKASGPIDRAAEFARVSDVVRKHLPAGYVERAGRSMMVWEVPLSVYPDTYNKHALWYAALAEQKNYLSLHLLGAYGSPALTKKLVDGFKSAGKRLDMGKACIRFKRADDLALDAIGEVVAALPMDRYVAMAKSWRSKK